jgi:adenylylsulfate kinase
MSAVYPIFDQLTTREDKERLLKQKSLVIWLTGLSGSGKSTIAIELDKILYTNHFLTQVLDGDNIRTGISNNLDFSIEGRKENLRRIAEVNKLYICSGLITINSFISPLNISRSMIRDIVGPDNFFLIFVDTPLEICESRDVKGLYAKARKGEISQFTGIDSPFEIPDQPNLTIKTQDKSPIECAKDIYQIILPKIQSN